MENLTKLLGGPTLFIKRDDCTGLATGGNKSRKLEFLMADAVQKGADTVITQGDVQSNHVRQTAAAAAKLGMKCEAVLGRRVEDSDPDFDYIADSGNVFLDHLFDVSLRYVPGDADMTAVMEEVADEVRSRGGNPYIIPSAGGNPIGALGYVNCAHELVQQARDLSLRIDYVVHTTGGTTTQAGLVVGFLSAGSGIKVYGISSGKPKAFQEDKAHKFATDITEFAGVSMDIPRDRIMVNSDYVGPGYGLPTPGMVEAVTLTARNEGILLDPVYTGKGMAGLIDLSRKGFFSKDDNVVFLHTGGSPALFAYQQVFASA